MKISRIIYTAAFIALSLTASVVFSIRSFSGCDFIRLHFEALNDNGIYFSEESYVGVGFFWHQSLGDKNSIDWINDNTCHKYDDTSKGMFLKGNLHSVKALLLSSSIVDMVAVILLLVTGVFIWKMKKSRTESSFGNHKEMHIGEETIQPQMRTPILLELLLVVMTGTAMGLHLLALSRVNEDGGICDRNNYFPDGWFDRYPLQSYREYAYFKFFRECEMGKDGVNSVVSKNCQIMAFTVSCVSLLMRLYDILLSKDDETCSKDDDTVGSTETAAGQDVLKQFPLQVETL